MNVKNPIYEGIEVPRIDQCQKDQVEISELFSHVGASKLFKDGKKKEDVKPYWEKFQFFHQVLRKAGRLHVYTHQGRREEKSTFAATTLVQTNPRTWFMQNTMSDGNPVGLGTVGIYGLQGISPNFYTTMFSPGNKFSKLMVGPVMVRACNKEAEKEVGWIRKNTYFLVNPNTDFSPSDSIKVKVCENEKGEEVSRFLEDKYNSKLYPFAEYLEDLELKKFSQDLQKLAGLSWNRSVLEAQSEFSGKTLGYAFLYHFDGIVNFRFHNSRIQLFLNPNSSEEEKKETASSLMHRAIKQYKHKILNFAPGLIDSQDASILEKIGIIPQREYFHSIFSPEGIQHLIHLIHTRYRRFIFPNQG